MSEQNKEIVHQGFEHFVKGHPEAGGFKPIPQDSDKLRQAFFEIKLEIDEQVAEGELVATRWKITGTHASEFLGVESTGNRVTVTGIDMSRVVDGEIVESWSHWDELGLLRQLGVEPVEGQS